MTLWNVLLAMCFFSPFCGAAVEANYHHAGLRGYLIAVGLGIPLGAVFAWGMWIAGGKVTQSAAALITHSKKEWLFRALLAVDVLWIALGLTAGLVLYSFVMKVPM
jgi:hypothetical protein